MKIDHDSAMKASIAMIALSIALWVLFFSVLFIAAALNTDRGPFVIGALIATWLGLYKWFERRG